MNKEELLVSLCQEAIRIPSMSGHEKEVAGLLKKTMIYSSAVCEREDFPGPI